MLRFICLNSISEDHFFHYLRLLINSSTYNTITLNLVDLIYLTPINFLISHLLILKNRYNCKSELFYFIIHLYIGYDVYKAKHLIFLQNRVFLLDGFLYIYLYHPSHCATYTIILNFLICLHRYYLRLHHL